MTRILSIEPAERDDEPAWLAAASRVLRAAEIVAIPTETFYGLAVDPRSSQAVTRLRRLKGHPPGRSILLLAAGLDQVGSIAMLQATAGASALAAAFWPGPLTLVLPLRPGVALPSCPEGTVAVRVTEDVVARRLARDLGSPITGTSANPAGAEPPGTAREVSDYFPDGVALILDAGASPGRAPSTLLDLTGTRPRLLRSGALPAGPLETVLGRRISGARAPGARP